MTDRKGDDHYKSPLLDHNTFASLPARLRCNLLKYAFHYPVLPGFFVITQVSAWYCFTLASSSLLIPAVLSASLIFLYWKHIAALCWHGDLCPAKVISTNPLLIAVHTDLTLCDAPFPVIKIMKPPHLTFGRKTPCIGDRLAAVALYKSTGRYHGRWDDFTPRPIQCVTLSKSRVQSTIERIPHELWDDLDENLNAVSEPQSPGLYHKGELISYT